MFGWFGLLPIVAVAWMRDRLLPRGIHWIRVLVLAVWIPVAIVAPWLLSVLVIGGEVLGWGRKRAIIDSREFRSEVNSITGGRSF